MTPPSTPRPSPRLTQLARQRFVDGMCSVLPALDKTITDFITHLMDQAATQRAMQQRRDAWINYQAHRKDWLERLARAWRKSLTLQPTTTRSLPELNAIDGLELVSDEVVESKLLASRMALTVTERVASAFDSVRQRTQHLEDREMDSSDILRPESLCLKLVEQWLETGLLRDELQLVLDPLQRELGALALEQYQGVARLYDEQGVVVSAQQRVIMRQSSSMAPLGHSAHGATGPHSAPDPLSALAMQHTLAQMPPFDPTMFSAPLSGGAPAMLPLFGNPFERARQRAQGVMMQLRRLLAQPGTAAIGAKAPPASEALMHAFAAQRVQAESYYGHLATVLQDFGPQTVVQVAQEARQRAGELKQKADTDSEKAIIEIVALMFQSILNEDRIPPAVRVWFARLQVPVLRVALAEPEFFNNLEHPARKLIDRMGGCVLGFDAAAISGSALEAEIRRVVQVIEQYPETGRRVFELVYGEFEKFLAKFLTEAQRTSRIVSLAQQMEQKEALAIQYTIELRTLLKDMPIREEIREFLFKIWSEVLAMSAVRRGAQHAETVAYTRTASELVWAASAKPSRSERAKVIQSLPTLLERLRRGLALTGLDEAAQGVQIKQLTDTLADAFLAKSATIPPELIDAMAKRLANLEDYLSDDGLDDIPLSSENIEMLLGIDASSIHVIADNGAPVEDQMLDWAQQLPPGAWYVLEHNGASAQVQYVWHSERQQLHLFVAADGTSYLIQLKRLAAYLQANLLVAQEDEALTMRATREALTQLGADPERLLA